MRILRVNTFEWNGSITVRDGVTITMPSVSCRSPTVVAIVETTHLGLPQCPPKGKYTNPDLRVQIKQEIHGGDKGGKPGQWSARKAQLVASEYKKARRGLHHLQGSSPRRLSKTPGPKYQEWQTQEGSGTAREADDTRKRYLPKQAWKAMSAEEKQETETKKIQESGQGRQFVENTVKARSARRKASDAVASDNQDTSEDEEQSS